MKIDCNFVLHGTQLGGGLFMGIKLEYPVSIYDEQINETYKLSTLHFGFLIFTLKISVTHGHEIRNDI